MRITILLVLTLGLGGIWLAMNIDGSDATEARAKAHKEASARAGLRLMLKDQKGFGFRDVVFDRYADGFAFRGFLLAEEAAHPTYGIARPVCADRLNRPTCWRISYLEANGQPIVLAEGARLAAQLSFADMSGDLGWHGLQHRDTLTPAVAVK